MSFFICPVLYLEAAELSPKHAGTILIGKMCVNTPKLTGQLALFTFQSGSSREAGSLPRPCSIPHTPNPCDQKGLRKENFLLCWLICNEMEDTFIFSLPAFKGKWESYEFVSLWDEIKYSQCLAYIRSKSMNIDYLWRPRELIQVGEHSDGLQGSLGMEHPRDSAFSF